MDFGLKGKIAIVTGAAGGIGGAVARDFAREGVNLSLPYHRKACTDLIEEIKGFGIETMTVHADICNANDIEALVQATYDRFGAIDILVNNAGAGLLGSVEDTTEEDWDRMMALNLKSVFLLSKAVLKHMKQQRWGRIINIGSVLAKTATNARPWIDPQGRQKRAAAPMRPRRRACIRSPGPWPRRLRLMASQ